jgi:MFS family permease
MEATDNKPDDSGLMRIWRSLRHRNFRLFFIGQGISLIGTWMQTIAMGWQVYLLAREDEETKAFWMGMVAFATQIPSLVILPFAGVFIDRWNRHRVLVVTQTLMMLQAVVLTVLAFLGVLDILQLILLSLFLGAVNAVDLPTRQTFLSDMVTSREDLANAIALNSSLFHGARLIGPTLAGLLIMWTGPQFCFLLNALSFVAVIACLLLMDVVFQPKTSGETHVLQHLKEGFRYAFGFAPIRTIILLVALVSFVGMPYTVFLPIFANEVLLSDADKSDPKAGARLFGFLMTASGVGALTGALYMASRKTVLGLGLKIALACGLFSVGLMAFALSTNKWLSMGLMAVVGFALIVQMASCNTVLQTIVDDDKRGRVLSIYTLAFLGVGPFGSLLAGWLAKDWGAPTTVLVGGALCLGGALYFALKLGALRKLIRPIYVRRGILPEAAAGVQAATALTAPPKD